ncbi:MAG: pyridoxamine 5'-phosphate oxidase family protein [Lachnospiraceae bacterium]|nr:pyridoxamine 5'-phosphate oxidase family protein [Lachnospiraceae bacterium]
MFRELSRKNKAISEAECVRLLKEETRGVLCVLGDDEYPYGMPMNHFYNEEDGCIYFHCGKAGHRLDALQKHDKVSFCVYDKGVREDGDWALHVNSVIVFGKLEVIDDMETIMDISARLSRKFTQDEEYIQKEIELYAKATLLLKLRPEHMCGKRVKES